jgi:hypothetical protein
VSLGDAGKLGDHFKDNCRLECQSDTLILVDSTGSVSKIFADEKAYVEKLLSQLDPAQNRVSLIVYSSRYRHAKLLSFKSEQTKKSFTSVANCKSLIYKYTSFLAIPFFNGITATGAALESALKELENRRKGIPANVVVVTDGFS